MVNTDTNFNTYSWYILISLPMTVLNQQSHDDNYSPHDKENPVQSYYVHDEPIVFQQLLTFVHENLIGTLTLYF